MKFQVQAYVVVVDTTGSVGWSAALQMIGRSSRKFGTQTGFVITKSNVMATTLDVTRALQTQDTSNERFLGVGVAKAILSAWDSSPSDRIKGLLATVCKDNKWQCRFSEFGELSTDATLMKLLLKHLK